MDFFSKMTKGFNCQTEASLYYVFYLISTLGNALQWPKVSILFSSLLLALNYGVRQLHLSYKIVHVVENNVKNEDEQKKEKQYVTSNPILRDQSWTHDGIYLSIGQRRIVMWSPGDVSRTRAKVIVFKNSKAPSFLKGDLYRSLKQKTCLLTYPTRSCKITLNSISESTVQIRIIKLHFTTPGSLTTCCSVPVVANTRIYNKPFAR